MGKKPIPLPKDEVIALYLAGETTVSLAKKYGCSRPPVNRLLAKAGVVRSITEDNARRYRTMGVRERKLQVKAANKAARGRVQAVEEKTKRARTREGSFRSRHERSVSLAFTTAGIDHVPQLAIEIFNADIGVPAMKLLVELDGGEWHGTPLKAMYDRRYEAAVTALGWRVLRYRSRALQYPHLIALDVKAIGSDPTFFARERVVRRYVKDLMTRADAEQRRTMRGLGPRDHPVE